MVNVFMSTYFRFQSLFYDLQNDPCEIIRLGSYTMNPAILLIIITMLTISYLLTILTLKRFLNAMYHCLSILMVLPRKFYICELERVTDSLEPDHMTLYLRSVLKHESEARNVDFSFMRKISFRYNKRESNIIHKCIAIFSSITEREFSISKSSKKFAS